MEQQTPEQQTKEQPPGEQRTAEKPAAPDPAAKAEAPKVRFCTDELIALLEAEPLLCMKLTEALIGGRWLITIHRKDRELPPDDLKGWEIHKDFPIGEIATTMQTLCRSVLADAATRLHHHQEQANNPHAWK